MKIIDTYDSIFNVYRDDAFSRKLWENYAKNIYSGLKEKIEKTTLTDWLTQQTMIKLYCLFLTAFVPIKVLFKRHTILFWKLLRI